MNTAVTSLPLTPAGDASASAGVALRHGLRRVGSGLWKALEAVGRARAQPHLKALADQCEAQQPELARELRAALRNGAMS